ncbi:DUF1493 family protein [Leclercia pneumoniae]|uniref:DUF1493 family protein n=1 Tax=Leclercia pneumoniae TaxID=2815358 RepID=UPI002DB7EC17|nr:DUF1493 family protein [Leclercia pneumoniae]MEB7501784.1 DUF1493 family protein [Leclercia pneumoniae]
MFRVILRGLSTFDGRNVFEYEYPFWQKRPSPVPLTVVMIIESVKADKWFYR